MEAGFLPNHVLILDPMPLHGGEEQHIVMLTEELSLLGFKVSLAVSNSSPWIGELREKGCEVIVCDMSRRLSPSTLFHLRAWVKQADIDLIHSHGGRGGLYGRILGYLTGRPVVHTWHLTPQDWAGSRPIKRQLYYWGEFALSKLTDHYIAVSTEIESNLIQTYGILPTHVTRIVNRIKKPAAVIIKRPISSRKQIVCIGRLSPQKGFHVLLESLGKLQQQEISFSVKILGDGPEQEILVRLAKTLNLLDNVEFMGYQAEPHRILDDADLFVLPSLWEGTPLVLLEAMAHRLPIVATAVGGNRELLTNYGPKLLVRPADSVALAQAIECGLKLTWASDEDMLAVSHFFDAQAMARETAEVYQQVLGQSMARSSSICNVDHPLSY